MTAALAAVLTDQAVSSLRLVYRRARRQRDMGPVIAALFTLLSLLVCICFRVEAPAWQRLRDRYRPWFTHLSSRQYRFADPLRYVLQGLWLVAVMPVRQAGGPVASCWRRAIGRLLGGLRVGALMLVEILQRRASRFKVSGERDSPYQPPFQALPPGVRKLLFSVLGVVSLALTALLITQPFSLTGHLIFIVLLWSVAMLVRRVPGRYATLILIVLSLTVSGRYIWWRYTATLNWNDTMDMVFGLMLLAAETYSWIVLLMGYVQTAWPLQRGLAPLPADRRLWPTVDVMIPTYNEDLSVVMPTVYAARGLDWPKDKLRIHLLDDGRRQALQEFAAEAGVNYITRPDGRHAKAGNLNHAMAQTDGELLALFDCDHIPTRPFLQMTVGWFLKDRRLALVQTPHHFFSPDPFERNLDHFGKQPNENTLFYGLVQDGNDLWNAAFFCGSCAVLRRTALNDIGGFATETVTEDAHTALRLHRWGYNSAYLRIPLAAGLATESLSAHVGQRIRWARGMVQIFRTDNPLAGKGLSLAQRLCYMNAMMHFLSGIPRLIYLTAPLAFLLLHSYIIYAPAMAILLYVLPHIVHASLTNSHMQGAYRRTFWGEIYETVLSWYIAWPTTVALLFPGKGAFNVTAKGGLVQREYFDWAISMPYMLLALANSLGLGFGVWRLWTGPANELITVLITMFWVIYNLLVLGGAVAVAAEGKQVRRHHRVASSMPVDLQLAGGQVHSGVLSDFSEGGAGLILMSPQAAGMIEAGDRVRLIMTHDNRQFSFPAIISRRVGSRLGMAFDALNSQQHMDLIHCTFARADCWLTSQDRFPLDRPMRSLLGIIRLGLRGYRRMADHLPFPLNVLLHKSIQILAWPLSFLPRSHPLENHNNDNRQMASDYVYKTL